MLASCSEERANRWMLADKSLTFLHHEIDLTKRVTHLLRGSNPSPAAGDPPNHKKNHEKQRRFITETGCG